MSASTPPEMSEETRIELPDESRIPLPSSVASSELGENDEHLGENPIAADVLQTQNDFEAEIMGSLEEDPTAGPASPKQPTVQTLDGTNVVVEGRGPPHAINGDSIPLFDLLEVMDEDKYQSRRLMTLQDEAYGLFHKCGSCDRFLTVQTHLYRRMVDCFRSDKKNAFASFYTKAVSYPSFADLEAPVIGFEDTSGALRLDPRAQSSDTSWIQRLPTESRKNLMDFLTNIRNDPSFIAERICKLSESQLRRLARPHRLQGANDSILPSSRGYGRYDSRGFQRSVAKPGDQAPSVDDMMGDPLMLLINGLFDSSSGPASPERLRQLKVWSSICCKLIENSKPGSDEFCITVLNGFAEMSEWPIAPALELLLADIIATGEPLNEGLGSQARTFTPGSNSHQMDQGQLVSTFFDQALQSLLDLIGDDPHRSVPSRALEMIRSVLHQIDNQERRLTARNFFFLRWFCASFLYNAIVFPEAHGIMMDHSLSNNVRHNILRELVVRLQKVVTDVLSPWSSTPVNPVLEAKIRKLLQSFEEEPSKVMDTNTKDQQHQGRPFLFLRPEDVLAVSKSLYAEGYPESSSNSAFDPPSSRSSSVFGLPSFSPVLRAGDPQYLQAPSRNMMHNNTWHAGSFGGRPSISDSAYGAFDRSQAPRPESSGGHLGDPEKEDSPPFAHDLWLITANREFNGPGFSRRHEAVVLFINDRNTELSLSPFQNSTAPPAQHMGTNDMPAESVQGMPHGDSLLLASALSHIAENFPRSRDSLSCSSDSLGKLRAICERNLREARSNFDFQAEYFWWNCLRTLQTLDSSVVHTFLAHMFQRRQALVKHKQYLSDQYEEWLYILRQRSKIQDQATQRISLSSKRLRNKMWYASDVRSSGAYEDTENVVRALKAMIEPVEQRPSSVTVWARNRIRNSFGHERVLAQTLDLMSAPKTYGGPNKLSESQVQITNEWLLSESIENFCRGEERIHRFCYEIQKCVKRLAGESMLDSPVLWSSPLYQIEKAEHGVPGNAAHRHSQEHPSWNTDFSYLHTWNMASNLSGQSPPLSFSTSAESPSSLHSGISGMHPPYSLSASPQVQDRTFIPRNWVLPPSPISPSNVKTSNEGSLLRRRAFLQNLRTHLTSLLLSDLGLVLWSKGSETDTWMSRPEFPTQLNFQSSGSYLGGVEANLASASRNLDTQDVSGNDSYNILQKSSQLMEPGPHSRQDPQSFDFSEKYRTLLKRFKLSPHPQHKLQYLYELFLLAGYSCQAQQYQDSLGDSHSKGTEHSPQSGLIASVLGIGVPRTRLTRLQEVAANCEDRRTSSLANLQSPSIAMAFNGPALPSPRLDDPALLGLIQSIFADAGYRPSTLFRDLQFIASLTPSSTLDYTPQGTAFWTIGLAAMSVKSAKCKSMTDSAMQILEFHYGTSNLKEPARLRHGSHELATMASSAMSQQDLLGTTLQDAARLLTISALEGDPTAARELALFHLTHPELVSRVTLPLSRPSDVFRVKHGGASERGHRSGGEDSGILDPITFAVVFHWMEFAANAGDADAITFFKENEGLGKAL